MRRAFVILALCGAVSAASAQAPAKAPLGKHDTSAPINIAADRVTADIASKTVTYSGNVVITQADLKMRADAVKAETANNQANRITATGKVVVDSPSSGTATGDTGVYDVPGHLITLTGRHVVLTNSNKIVSSGTKLMVNLMTGIASFTSDKSQGGTGRVGAILNPAPGN
jgi:lipopolysaccharide export system protein LptA